MNERFGKVEERFEDRFGEVGARFGKVEERFEDRFDKVDRRFERLEHRFDALNARFDGLQRTLIAGIIAGFIGLIVSNVT
jgi:hypothetical protein